MHVYFVRTPGQGYIPCHSLVLNISHGRHLDKVINPNCCAFGIFLVVHNRRVTDTNNRIGFQIGVEFEPTASKSCRRFLRGNKTPPNSYSPGLSNHQFNTTVSPSSESSTSVCSVDSASALGGHCAVSCRVCVQLRRTVVSPVPMSPCKMGKVPAFASREDLPSNQGTLHLNNY